MAGGTYSHVELMQRVKEAMQAASMSRVQLADQLEVTVVMIIRAFQGRDPSLLRDIAECVLKVPVQENRSSEGHALYLVKMPSLSGGAGAETAPTGDARS